MWESSFEGALRGTRFCKRAPVGTQGGSSRRMTDDGKKRTDLESSISPDLFGNKEPNIVGRVTRRVKFKPSSIVSDLNDDISIKCLTSLLLLS